MKFPTGAELRAAQERGRERRRLNIKNGIAHARKFIVPKSARKPVITGRSVKEQPCLLAEAWQNGKPQDNATAE